MNRVLVALTFMGFLAPAFSQQESRLGDKTAVVFASVDEGKRILMERDAFVRAMSPFDRAARMKTDKAVSEEEFLAFVGQNVLPWPESDRAAVEAALEGLKAPLKAMALPLPPKVHFILTTGQEEGGAAYTRDNAVVIPKSELDGGKENLKHIICHELFHILTRSNPALKEKLYAAIGFEKCDEVAFPPTLAPRKITNPDAPLNDHCIRVTVDGKPQWVVPILYSSQAKYDPARGGEFFQYLEFRLLLVDRAGNSSHVTVLHDGSEPRLAEFKSVSGFFEQVGQNTGYVIHPEEILADNFALLVLGKTAVPSPQVLAKIKAVLEAAKATPTATPQPKD